MVATRRNILQNDQDRDRFIESCRRLKLEQSGMSTSDIGINAGPLAGTRALSTWDLFVIWHSWAMSVMSNGSSRNAAHMGPVFLPWHRWYLLSLERQMQRVLGLGPDDFGMPYWDWTADGGDLTLTQQRRTAPIWRVVGGDGQLVGDEVADGPFTKADFVVNVEQDPNGQLRATDRGLRRQFGRSAPRLPRTAHVDSALADPVYDRPNWDASSDAFRNRMEGWVPAAQAPMTHNLVHVWVGGDMLPGTSPNDPVFFLNHCNVDRIWAIWQINNPTSDYQPQGQSAPTDTLYRHRSLDPLYSPLTQGEPVVQDMLDVSAFYGYA